MRTNIQAQFRQKNNIKFMMFLINTLYMQLKLKFYLLSLDRMEGENKVMNILYWFWCNLSSI